MATELYRKLRSGMPGQAGGLASYTCNVVNKCQKPLWQCFFRPHNRCILPNRVNSKAAGHWHKGRSRILFLSRKSAEQATGCDINSGIRHVQSAVRIQIPNKSIGFNSVLIANGRDLRIPSALGILRQTLLQRNEVPVTRVIG